MSVRSSESKALRLKRMVRTRRATFRSLQNSVKNCVRVEKMTLHQAPKALNRFLLFAKIEIYSDGVIMGIQGHIEYDAVDCPYVPELGLGEEGSNVEPDIVR